MRRKYFIAIAVVILSTFIISGNYSLSQALKPLPIKKNLSKVPQSKQEATLKLDPKVKIISIKTGTKRTSRSGQPWYWTATVANTGISTVKKGDVILEATQVFKSGKKSFISSVNLPRDIAPKAKINVSGRWSNGLAKSLTVVVIQKVNLTGKKVLSTKTVSVPEITARIDSFSFQGADTEWKAVIRNTSKVPLSFTTRCTMLKDITTYALDVKDTPVLPPNGTVTYTGRDSGISGSKMQYYVQYYYKLPEASQPGYGSLAHAEYSH